MRKRKRLGALLPVVIWLIALAALPVLAAGPGPAPGLTEVVANGDFEQGRTGWTEYSKHDYAIIYNESDLPVRPYSGDWAAWLGGADDEVSYIEQTVDVPAGPQHLTFRFWIVSVDVCDAEDDRGEVRIDGAAVDTLRLCEAENTGRWAKRILNLSAYAGETVELQIWATTDDSDVSSLYVDDVSIHVLRALLPLVVR